MFSGGHIHFDLLDKLKALRTKYGRKILALYYCDLAAQGFWINQITNSQDEADRVYAEWGANKSWKRPEGLPQELEDPFIDACVEIDLYLNPDYKQVENEPGDTLDAQRSVWQDSTPGYINPRLKSFLNRLVAALDGQIVSAAWEQQDWPTYSMQVDSGSGIWERACALQGVNCYFVHYQAGDTPQTLAQRFWTSVRDCAPYRWPVAVTEGNVVGIPAEMEMPALLEIRRTKPSWCKFFCFYYWSRA